MMARMRAVVSGGRMGAAAMAIATPLTASSTAYGPTTTQRTAARVSARSTPPAASNAG